MKTQVTNELFSRIEQDHNYGEESLLRWKQLPHKSPRSLGKEENDKYKSRLITYKFFFVEARGEYQTTRYSASKPLNTS